MPTSRRGPIALVPAHRPQQVAEALQWRPDALCLDLADLVPSARRTEARKKVREALAAVKKGGVESLVRVSAEDWKEDLESAVWPGLSAVVVPGLVGPREVEQREVSLAVLEKERGLTPGAVGLVAYLDHGKGLWYARDIARASHRLQALVLGMGDLAFDMLQEPETVPFFTGPVPRFPVPAHVWGRMALIAAEARVGLLGLLGTTIAPGHGEKGRFVAAAELARQMGFRGAFTFHREAVEACKQVFGPPREPAPTGQEQTTKE